jgi:pyruvate/2-oxoglutarate dehydrogenase complex dihydrolipoamide acyltransferase (E2) component
MEMESMEDGYVAKLLKPEGAQNITVGEVRPLCTAAGVRQLCGNC